MASDAQVRLGLRPGIGRRLRYVIRARWWWPVCGGAVASALGFVVGYQAGWFSAKVGLQILGVPTELALARPATAHAERSAEGIWVELARSDLVARRVSEAAGVRIRPEALVARMDAHAADASGLITITARSRDAEEAIRLANVWAQETVAAASELLTSRRTETQRQVQAALQAVDVELQQASQQLAEFQRRTAGLNLDSDGTGPVRALEQVDQRIEQVRGQLAGVELQIKGLVRELASLSPALVAARDALAQALTRYTEQHPRVKELQATVTALEKQLLTQSEADSPPAGTLTSPAAASLHLRLGELKSQQAALLHEWEGLLVHRQQLQAQVKALADCQTEYVQLKSRFDALKQQRFALAQSWEALNVPALEQGYARVVTPATRDSLGRADKLRRGSWGAAAGALAGLGLSGLLAVALPAAVGRVRSARALGQLTGLPVLGSLGDLRYLTEEERQHWAFNSFTRLRARLGGADGQPLVCGLISAQPGEGRSTWIRLLAEAARRQGYEVVTLDISRRRVADSAAQADASAGCLAADRPAATWLPEIKRSNLAMPTGRREAVLPTAWAWDPGHRVQWRQALREWQTVPGLVVLIELPPAVCPEAVLLAEDLPNLIWVCDRAGASAGEIRRHLETLRTVRAGLVGCVFNRGKTHRRTRALRVGAAVAGLLAGLVQGWATGAAAQETNLLVPGPVPVATNAAQTISISTTDQLAEWQKRLTLGPGDTFDLSLYERPETARAGVTIGPDGRINYLEARDVMAAGLTIDELRAKLEEILSKFHRAPRVVINPTAFVSKKYYVLGNVNGRGVYPLDRPVSLVEAVARARGFVLAHPQQQTWPQADFGRSFLIRRRSDGTFGRVPVDFEALFLEGDLSQNIALEPDDYLFFPPLETQEVYVLGEVNAPGPLPYTPNLTALGAITARGGFTTRAYKSKVVVIRGSLSRPQTFVVNVADIWKARGLDMRLQNRDIVYVHERPFARAEELVEQAALTFVQSLATGWANLKVFGRVRGFR